MFMKAKTVSQKSYLLIAVDSKELESNLFKYVNSYKDDSNLLIGKIEVFYVYGKNASEMIENLKSEKEHQEEIGADNIIGQEWHEKITQLYQLATDESLVKEVPQTVLNYWWTIENAKEKLIFLQGKDLPKVEFFE